MRYTFPLEMDPEQFDGRIADLFRSVNATLAEFGVVDRVGCRCEVGTMGVTVERPLTTGEEELMRQCIQSAFDERTPELKLTVAAPRRQSGNVPQSVG